MFVIHLMFIVVVNSTVWQRRNTEAQTKGSALKSTNMQHHVRIRGTAFLSGFRWHKHGSWTSQLWDPDPSVQRLILLLPSLIFLALLNSSLRDITGFRKLQGPLANPRSLVQVELSNLAKLQNIAKTNENRKKKIRQQEAYLLRLKCLSASKTHFTWKSARIISETRLAFILAP